MHRGLVVLGGARFLMSEVPLYLSRVLEFSFMRAWTRVSCRSRSHFDDATGFFWNRRDDENNTQNPVLRGEVGNAATDATSASVLGCHL